VPPPSEPGRARSQARASLRCCRTSPRAGASAGNAASGPAVARAETGSGPERTASRGTHGLGTSRNPTRGTAKIRPKCAIGALRTGERTQDRRLLRMPFSEENSMICCGECESPHRAARRIRFREQDSVLRRLPRARESPETSLDEHDVPVLGATAGAYRGWSTAYCRFRAYLGWTRTAQAVAGCPSESEWQTKTRAGPA
jgi:hypothetical protein